MVAKKPNNKEFLSNLFSRILLYVSEYSKAIEKMAEILICICEVIFLGDAVVYSPPQKRLVNSYEPKRLLITGDLKTSQYAPLSQGGFAKAFDAFWQRYV
jgi:hypothetical protein